MKWSPSFDKSILDIDLPYKNLSIHDLLGEEWLPIYGYENRYMISSLGRVKSLNYRRIKGYHAIIKQQLINAGYLRIELSVAGNRRFVHRLVAEAFIANPDNKPEVNHKFGITVDNRASELEWFTKSEQMIHSYDVLKNIPATDHLLKYVVKTPVNKLDPQSGEILETFESQTQAAVKYGLKKDRIRQCIDFNRIAAGYKWSFA